MTTFTVTTLFDTVFTTVPATSDDGLLSLREAIGLADITAGDVTIEFSDSLAGGTLSLTNGQIEISDLVTITGDTDEDGVADITIDAVDTSRVFRIFNNADVTLHGLNIVNGDASSIGGGAATITSTSQLTVTNSVIGNNSAAGNGGAFFNEGTLIIGDSTLSGNIASSAGGAINSASGSTLTVFRSTFFNNSAEFGGGISVAATDAVIRNTSLVANQASGSGGAIEVLGGGFELQHVTITGNSASSAGGGITSSGLSTEVVNSLIVGNTASTGSNLFGFNGTTTNSITSGNAEDIFETVSFGAGVLADNGGLVQTVALLADLSNPALDIGDFNIPTDARGTGFGRMEDVPGTGADNSLNVSDAGAFELQEDAALEEASLVVTTLFDIIDPFDNQTSLREAVNFANSNADISTITFDESLAGETIFIGINGDLALTTSINIDGDINGDERADITISANNAAGLNNADDRIFTITTTDVVVNLDSLTLRDGNSTSGGAILMADNTLTLTNSTITDNTAGLGGAIFAQFGSVATILNSTIHDNQGTDGGGAIFAVGNADIDFINATLTGNVTQGTDADGGAINAGSSTDITLANTTITQNSVLGSGSEGGGIHIDGNLTLINSIILNNISQGSSVSSDEFSGAAVGNIGFTLGPTIIGELFAATFGGPNTSIINADFDSVFLDGSLADNGGPVETIALNAVIGNVAIDNGIEVGFVGDFDARGFERNVLAPGSNAPATVVADLGAYEAQINVIHGTENGETISSSNTFDIINADGGGDTILAGAGSDTLDGGMGPDTVIFNGDFIAYEIDFNLDNNITVADNENFGDIDILIDIEEIQFDNMTFDVITGTSGSDNFIGEAGNNLIFGFDDSDTILGQSSADIFFGGTGSDFLNGFGGSDTLNGGSGIDLLAGGADGDTINGGADGDSIFGEGGADTLNGDGGVDAILGGSEGDTINGGDDGDALFGQKGDDRINGDAGVDLIFGEEGSDILSGGDNDDVLFGDSNVPIAGEDNDELFGNGGGDNLFAGGGRDILDGGAGSDSLFGQEGDDILIGGADLDALVGGAGEDTFFFTAGFGTDFIIDFEDNVDTINLSGLGLADVNAALASGTAFQATNGVFLSFNGGADTLMVFGDTLAIADLQDDIDLGGFVI